MTRSGLGPQHPSRRQRIGRPLGNAIILATLLLTGCAVSGPGTSGPAAAPVGVPDAQAPPLVIFFRAEPASLATRSLGQKSASVRTQVRPLNALIASMDDRALPRPELVASLPELNTSSWVVNPDGTMQTTYTLRPGVTWHDGHALTADDFVFSWHVYIIPELGYTDLQPFSAITDVAASDREHVVIRWKAPYPDAHTLSEREREFPPLPQHILGSTFDQVPATGTDALANHPYWTQQYVSVGPYRVQRWEPGSFLDLVRVEGYPLGMAKIPRIEERFSDDQNIVVANLLAGTAHAATASALPAIPEALIEQWSRTRAGSVFSSPTSWQHLVFQLRSDYANPRSLLDVRVRKAVARSIDKQAVSDAVFDGQAVFSDTAVWSGSGWGDALDDSIPTYPFDLRAAESLLGQSGYSKGSDGAYRGPEGRLSLELAISESPDSVRQILVMADSMRNAGLDVEQRVISRIQAQDAQVRATFPALQVVGIGLGEQALNALSSAQIPTPNNRWLGGNRGGWASPDYDRLLASFNT
ncbi:MAG TPA: ABC transporter substrate-binding protein, partial [Chloroflexota bacterium]